MTQSAVGSAPAWQVRSHERQEFIRAIQAKMFDAHEKLLETEKDGETFFFELSQVALEYLGGRHPEAFPGKPIFPAPPATHVAARRFWEEGILKPLEAFRRSDAEGDMLAARLLRDVIEPAAVELLFTTAEREELLRPDIILKAQSATDDIPFAT